MNLDMRREPFANFGELSEQTKVNEKQLANAEAVVECKMASIDGQLAEIRVYLAAAQARLPLDGALVKQGFEKIDKEIDLLKRNAHEASGAGITLTIPMLDEIGANAPAHRRIRAVHRRDRKQRLTSPDDGREPWRGSGRAGRPRRRARTTHRTASILH